MNMFVHNTCNKIRFRYCIYHTLKIFIPFILQRDKEVELNLFKLYYIEDDIEKIDEDMVKKNRELKELEKKKEKMDSELKDEKRELGVLNKDLAAKEQTYREKVNKIVYFPWVFHYCY